jgi:hypothetical protein
MHQENQATRRLACSELVIKPCMLLIHPCMCALAQGWLAVKKHDITPLSEQHVEQCEYKAL